MKLIIVNAKRITWPEDTINYDTLVDLAWPKAKSKKGYTIVYSHRTIRGGSVFENSIVNLIDGMIFAVTRTDNA